MARPRYTMVVAAALLGVAAVLLLQRTRTPRDPFPEVVSARSNPSTALLSRPRLGGGMAAEPARPSASVGMVEAGLVEAPVEERMRFVDGLLGMDAGSLFELWVAGSQPPIDGLKLDFIEGALASKLRESDGANAVLIGAIRRRIEDPLLDQSLRWGLVNVLGRAGTVECLEALIGIYRVADEELRPLVLQCIAKMPKFTDYPHARAGISGVLESLWAQPEADEFKAAMALGIANAGTPSGVSLLLGTLTAHGSRINEFEAGAGSVEWFAFDALADVRDVRSIPVLKAALKDHDEGDIRFAASVNALARMGEPEASAAIISWARSTEADGSSYLSEWVLRIREVGSLKVATEAANGPEFRNPANRATLVAALAQWHRERGE